VLSHEDECRVYLPHSSWCINEIRWSFSRLIPKNVMVFATLCRFYLPFGDAIDAHERYVIGGIMHDATVP
jgi:hypothetical protein